MAVRDQVFISDSKQDDAVFARRLAQILRTASFQVWLDEHGPQASSSKAKAPVKK